MLRIGISKVVLDKVVTAMIEDSLEICAKFEEFTRYSQRLNLYTTVV